MKQLSQTQQTFLAISKTQDAVLMLDGKPVMVPLRVPVQGEHVIIDALNCVMSVNTFTTTEMMALETNVAELVSLDLDDEQAEYLDSLVLQQMLSHTVQIFGDEFAKAQSKHLGIHRYKRAYLIKSAQDEILLNIGIGGQNNTVFWGLTGTGCKHAKDGWELRLHDFLQKCVNAHISRIDLAHDDLQGKYSSFDIANTAESKDQFVLPMTRNRPACTIFGEYKHGDPKNKGLTLCVGSRKNGKIARCYEKGKQLGDTSSPWFRVEVELHGKSKGRDIPLDVLLSPTQYFCGMYPYCLELIQLAKKHQGDHTPQNVERMDTIKNESKISLARAIEILKHQFGKYIKVFGEIFTKEDKTPDYKKIFDKIKTDEPDNYYPKRLRLIANYFGFNPKDTQTKKAIIDFESGFVCKTDKEIKQLYNEESHQPEGMMKIFHCGVWKWVPSDIDFLDLFENPYEFAPSYGH